MRTWILSLLVLLSGCAHLGQDASSASRVAVLFNDAAFAPPAAPIDTDGLFTLSPEMRRHLNSAQFKSLTRTHGPVHGLLHALYDPRDLQLDYDATRTGTAAETYAARKGNCLSLVIMTAAFARAMHMNVRFQEVPLEDTWSRERGFYLVSSHVNLSLAPNRLATSNDSAAALTVDFVQLPPNADQRVHPLDEDGIVARYMNNRAAEEMVQGRAAEAYWWARGALLKKPSLTAAYNTLAVIYQRNGQPRLAEQVYRAALAYEPDSLIMLQNLVPVLSANGKADEAAALAQRIARLNPEPPYYYFDQGMAAYRAGDYAQARTQFAREVARAPYNDEFHFWLGVANFQLGEIDTAKKQLALARDNSLRSDTRARYSAKLAHLQLMSRGAMKD